MRERGRPIYGYFISFYSALRTLLGVTFLLSLPAIAATGATIIETLNPNVYTVNAGDQFTITGTLSFPEQTTYAYGYGLGLYDEYLFGLSPSSPHLGLVAGAIWSSTDYPGGTSPGIPVYFQDVFGQGGWLGPTTVDGPIVTDIVNWRTFEVPNGTPSGTYSYSYGVVYRPGTEGILFASNLSVVVPAPEPSFLALTGFCLLILWARKFRESALRKAGRCDARRTSLTARR